MVIEGVEVSATRVADLALRLQRAGHRDLAQALGLAVDGNRGTFGVRTSAERAQLLLAAEAVPGEALRGLRAALARA